MATLTDARRLKVLFATPVPPLLTKPRPHHFVRGLARRGHEVHLLAQVASARAAEELRSAPGWEEVVEACASVSLVEASTASAALRCAASLPTTTPLRVAYCASREFARKARLLSEERGCDLAHVDRKRIAPSLASLPVPKILDATDSIALYLRDLLRYGSLTDRLVAAAELPKISRFERGVCRRYSACLATTEEDLEGLLGDGQRGGGHATRHEVLTNGVDGDLLSRGYAREARAEDTLLFVGTMHYPPNVDAVTWFARRVFPMVRAARPKASLRVVGRGPVRAIRRLGRLPGVEVVGGVPDVAPYLARASAFVAPLRIGGGFPNKVAEALAAGLPAVATPAAHAGLGGLLPGVHLLEAEDNEDFARSTIRLLEDAGLRDWLGQNGRAFMLANHRWEDVVDRLEDVYRDSLDRARRTELWERAAGSVASSREEEGIA